MHYKPYNTEAVSPSNAPIGEQWADALDGDEDARMRQAYTPAPDVRELISLTEQLSKVLEQESGLLKPGDVHKIAPLQEQKKNLSEALAEQKTRIAMHPEAIKALPQSEKDAMQDSVLRFQAAMQDNFKRLEAMRQVNHRMYQMMNKAVKAEEDHQHYTGQGIMRNPAAQAARAMKFNQTA